ncbi:MAG: 3-methylitaconate isomerase [Deltaproteobacteria bacterium]|nr:3-methylitaconate isomerase [Deltaproteobacteria bacterium]
MLQVKFPCVIMRGGSSKGVFFHDRDLPRDPDLRDRIIIRAFGSPDPRQIDGLGGSYSTTSKVVIIAPAGRPDVDVLYTFGQVNITAPMIDYKGNCGNLSGAVGPFAIDEGLVKAVEPVTTVRILNTNTNKRIIAEVPVRGGNAEIEGDCRIAGVPGTGAPVRLGYEEPWGSVTGKLFPTGKRREKMEVRGFGTVEVTILDAANPAVFVRAEELGVKGTERAEEIDQNMALSDALEEIRSQACYRCGLVDDPARATELVPAVPKVAYVARPADYTSALGEPVRARELTVCARIQSMQRAHRAYALTGAIATAAAAAIEGTVVHDVAVPRGDGSVVIGHPGGPLTLEVVLDGEGQAVRPKLVKSVRTARRLMDGYVYVPESVLRGR